MDINTQNKIKVKNKMIAYIEIFFPESTLHFIAQAVRKITHFEYCYYDYFRVICIA